MGRARPYRPSSRPVPSIKLRDRRKVCYYEYGTESDAKTGKTSLFVDIVSGNSDLVDFVGFRFWPSGETHNVYGRTPVILSDGVFARRFLLKRAEVSNWSKKVTVAVFGRGGSMRKRRLRAKLGSLFRERSLKFLETRDLRPNYVIAPSLNFGVEMEMSMDGLTTPEQVEDAIRGDAGVPVVNKAFTYQRGKEDYQSWQIVPDSSTECSRSDPNCNKFELVSRILNGEEGLRECEKVLDAMQTVGKRSCNLTMGLHVHVDVSDFGLQHLKNICLNFVKHEAAIDTLMPMSRRRSIYCKSNSDSIPEEGSGRKHNAITSCQTLAELCDLVNPGKAKDARYYKLNLQNIHPHRSMRKVRKSTMEFRQHSCTTDFRKVEAWVRFCMSLVQNSVYRPRSLRYFDDPFESLFDTVIQDIQLKEFYRRRRLKFATKCNDHDCANDNDHDHEGRDLCGGCRKGGACER